MRQARVELLQPTEVTFGNVYLALERVVKVKDDLRKVVSKRKFCSWWEQEQKTNQGYAPAG